MNKLRLISLLTVFSVLATVLTGCGSSGNTGSNSGTDSGSTTASESAAPASEDGRTHVTLMLDRDQQVDAVGTYLMQKYPDVQFDILLGRTGVSYLKKSAENNDLPDIIVSGSTWGRSGACLYPYLYDMSATDIASSFYTVYLDNYTVTDGSVYWLPGCASVEGILANKALFDQNGIALPTDYASFVSACEQLTQLGIRPYASDYKYDYTTAYLLQGWSIPLMQSEAGKSWRLSYEEGTVATLDETLGLQMFEKLSDVFAITGITPDDATRGYGKTLGEFTEGSLAMIRQSTALKDYYDAGMTDLVLMPYFGETEADNWYFTTPAYAVAMSGALKGSDKEELCLDIVRTMFSQECMAIFADQYNSFTAYNKGVTFDMDEEFANIAPYVQSNHMYSYLSQDSIIAASKASVQSMIADSTSPADALALFNETVTQTAEEQPVVATLDSGYSRQWTASGNRALSSIVNTLAQIADCDILLAPFCISSGSIYAGDHTAEELGNLLLGGGISLYRRELSGAEIRTIVATAVSGAGLPYDPIGLSTLPGVKGCTMVVSTGEDGRYHLDDLLVDGSPIADDARYTFVYAYTETSLLKTALSWNNDEHGGDEIAASEDKEGLDPQTYQGFIYPASHAADLWQTYFAEGGKLVAPTDYIQVK